MNTFKSYSGVDSYDVLFLKGVYKHECKKMEDMFQDRLLSTHKKYDTIVYDKMPAVFTGVNNWPKNTNLLCNTCSRTFVGFPWFEPQSIDPISEGSAGGIFDNIHEYSNVKEYSIIPKGVFCSVNCVIFNILKKTRDFADQHNKIEMLKFLFYIVRGKTLNSVRPSPDPIEMVQYGGNLTPLEYQKKIDLIDTDQDDLFMNSCSDFIRNIVMS